MTATRKTTVTHPDGTVSTRGSKTRTYAFAVEVSPATATDHAAELNRQADDFDRRAASLRAAADAGEVILQSRGFHTINPEISHTATLRGTDRMVYTWANAEGMTVYTTTEGSPPIRAVDYLTRLAREQADLYTADAVRVRSDAKRVLAAGAPVGAYEVVRWSSTAALAGKALNEFDHLARYGRNVRVVFVDAA